jgi:hypothetical protein
MEPEENLIEHLSKEIETHTNNLMTFRERINFAVFAGPFIVFLLAAKGLPHGLSLDRLTIAACVGLALSYVAMGMACATIERHIWKKCNEWRLAIGKIVAGNAAAIKDEDLTFPQKLYYGYLWVYLWMIIAFVCVVRIALHLRF